LIQGMVQGDKKEFFNSPLKIDTRNLAGSLDTGPPQDTFLFTKIKCAWEIASKKILEEFWVKFRLSPVGKRNQSKGGSYVQKN